MKIVLKKIKKNNELFHRCDAQYFQVSGSSQSAANSSLVSLYVKYLNLLTLVQFPYVLATADLPASDGNAINGWLLNKSKHSSLLFVGYVYS